MQGIGGDPQFDAPTLARVCRQLYERPFWDVGEPFPVDPETYQAARDEMAEVQKRRGFPVACAAIDRPNFLLRGIPVVMADG